MGKTYPLIAKITKLKLEVEDGLKQTKSGEGEKLENKFGKLFTAEKCSKKDYEEIE